MPSDPPTGDITSAHVLALLAVVGWVLLGADLHGPRRLAQYPSREPDAGATRNSPNSVWIKLFDGSSLAGWSVIPPGRRSDWTVQDGVIVGRASEDGLCYLVWNDRELCDFELLVEYRLPGKGNTGIEIRARSDPTGRRPLIGYHADLGHLGIGPHILGAWDFHFARRREPPCPRGTSLLIRPDGSLVYQQLRDPVGPDDIRKADWNQVRIVARGPTCRFFINGKLSAQFTDHAQRERFSCGLIGLQLHDKGMEVHFRNIRLRKLAAGSREP